jgi:hypothetical protein
MDWKGRVILRFVLFILLVLMACPVQAQQSGNDFRNFIWGATRADVKQYETAKFYKEEGDSVYFVELPGENDFRRVIRYDFKDDKLWRGEYEFQEYTEPNSLDVLNRYEDYVRELSKQYGEPTQDDFIWKDKTYVRYPHLWGRALLSGDLKRRTVWSTAKTVTEAEIFAQSPYYFLGYGAEAVQQSPQTNILGGPVSPDKKTP